MEPLQPPSPTSADGLHLKRPCLIVTEVKGITWLPLPLSSEFPPLLR
ncbi:MAG: hypothetical protein AB4352_02815 [Hormoscilla sp.]